MSKIEDRDVNEYLRKVEDQVNVILMRCLLKIKKDAVEIIDTNKANATGEMRRNIRYEFYKEAAKIVGVVGAGANVPYSIFRHEGTKPHWAPVAPIMRWVIKKGLVKLYNKPTSLSGVRNAPKKQRDRLNSEIKSIAIAIVKKIAKKGTLGLPYLKMALNQNLSYIQSEFSKIKNA